MSVTFTENKLECRVYLYRPDQGQSLQTTKPMQGLIHVVDAFLGDHPFWFGIIELPIHDDNLLRTFIHYRCDLVLADKRQGMATIVRVFAKDKDYMAVCVSGASKLTVV
jgi:hypothetical protein